MTKIFLAQIDTIAGNIEYNFDKIKKNIKIAKEKQAEIIIFSLGALLGYPIGDIANRYKDLLEFQNTKLEELLTFADNITIILPCFNGENYAISIIQNGKIANPIAEMDVIEINNNKYAIILKNNKSIIEKLKKTNINAIIHCDATPSRLDSEYNKNLLFTNTVQTLKTNYIYINHVGYNSNYVFDGASRIYNSCGQITARAKSFDEDLLETDNFVGKIEPLPLNSDKQISAENFSLDYSNDLARTYYSLLCGIKGYFNKNGFSKAILGLSGGLDSTIAAVLLSDALGKENVYAISMPTKLTSKESKNDGLILAKNLGIHYIEFPIINEYNLLKEELENVFPKINADQYNISTTFENIQARTRATILWSISNEFRGMLPIATSDKSEAYIGYATTNGDMSGGFAPIADITKTKLFALGDFLNKYRTEKDVIPKSILKKPPGAELKFDQEKGRTITAEEDNMPYPFLDEIIWIVENKNWGFEKLVKHNFIYEENNKISKEEKEKWILKFFDKMQKAVFKWNILPPSILVDKYTINPCEYNHPIISKVLIYNK